MNEDDFKAIDQRLADMSQRVDAVIAKESRGKRMPVLDFKPRKLSGGLTSQPAAHSRHKARYVPQPEPEPTVWPEVYREFSDEPLFRPETHIDQIFADFERQFDEMAQAHRQRG